MKTKPNSLPICRQPCHSHGFQLAVGEEVFCITPMRKPISKRLRFQIFARDGFTCRYCGRQSDIVPLHIDHVMPVSQGGGNEPENLVTSCVDCNLGKAAKTISQSAPTETDRLRMAQEMQEQITAARHAKASIEARKERRKYLEDFWMETTGRDTAEHSTLSVVFSYVMEYGEEVVFPWIEKAECKCYNDKSMGKYISGIRRLTRAEGGDK
jgi:hypothetical protein